MNSVILIASVPYESILRTRLERSPLRVVEGAGTVLVVDDGKSRVYLDRNDDVLGDLEPAELALITSKVAQPIFYTVDFSDIALCREVLFAIADDSELLVDDDHGVLLSGTDFVRALRSRPDWDWRTTQLARS